MGRLELDDLEGGRWGEGGGGWRGWSLIHI